MSDRSFKIMLLGGDGVGPEVLDEARALLTSIGPTANVAFEFSNALIGGAAIDAHGVPMRDEDVEAARQSDAILLGAVGGPKWDHLGKAERPEAGLLGLRKTLGLFANLRPVKVFDALANNSPLKSEIARGSDLMFVRELTGGLYFGRPSKRMKDETGRHAVDTLPYHESEIERIVDLAFRLARSRKKHVTSVDKANVLNTSQLWREVAIEVSERYPDVRFDHALVDSCAMRLISRPGDFDVMVMENLFGDVLSDEAAVLAGSLGMLPSASLNGQKPERQGTTAALFGMYEPVHGSAPDIAGQGVANPIGAILSAAMMLRFSFELGDLADTVEMAVGQALVEGLRTADIASSGEKAVSTQEMAARIRDLVMATFRA
ncbi:MAG: 3-isopropylmalate dehydrogenase [Nitrolancea sp.]